MTLHARHRIESTLAEGLQADFTLDVVGNISAIAGAGGAPVNGYSYDDLYRLTSESAPALSLAHAYDATGNRTAETVAGATTVYAYPPDSHRLTNIGGTERTFDAAGNLRVLNRSNRSSPEYAYDDRNRLAAYRVGGRDVATYAHNARGERVHKSAPKAGSATLFVYAEGGQLLGEYDADGNVLQEYAWLDALPVAVLKKSGPYPIEPDHLGTPRRAIGPELDRAVWAWDLQGPAFGTHAANDDPDADGQPFPLNLRFPGQYLDAESGLHYNYFRDYDPVTGRYVESDPIGLRGGVSTYGYVHGGPLQRADQFGLDDGFSPVPDPTPSPKDCGCKEYTFRIKIDDVHEAEAENSRRTKTAAVICTAVSMGTAFVASRLLGPTIGGGVGTAAGLDCSFDNAGLGTVYPGDTIVTRLKICDNGGMTDSGVDTWVQESIERK